MYSISTIPSKASGPTVKHTEWVARLFGFLEDMSEHDGVREWVAI
jgi:hypothetical protein